MLALALALGCPAPDEVPLDTGRVDDSFEPVDTSWPDDSDSSVDTQDETGVVVVDEDEDGYAREDDCDDDDASIHPGAEEIFDGYDNDCDGVIDANGSYSGTLTLQARGWYEGVAHDLEYECPMEMERGLTSAAWVVRCSTESDDRWGRTLIGATLTLEPDDDYLWDLESWEGAVVVTSSDGWDTFADGSLSWNTMEKATLVVGLDATWLDFTGSGKLKR